MNGVATLQNFGGPSILVIDDEERIREGCRKVLCKEGFDVETAASGEIGLKMIEEKYYDIVLLDLMMPNLSGFDVLSQVKYLHPDAVIIVISGYATIEYSIKAMKNGAFDFIPKPFTPDQLRVLVTKAIEYTRALKDIANEKSRMRVLINHLRDGVLAVDAEKRLVLANPAFFQMFGCDGEAKVGLSVSELCGGSRVESLIDGALSMPEGEFREHAEELVCEDAGGLPEAYISASCVPFRDRAGRNLGAITVLHDITAQKKMEHIKSDFVSMVSHEVRSPLNSVLAQLHVITDGLAGEVTPKQMEILGRASEKIKSLLSLSTELLDLARVESGLATIEKERVNPAEILEDQAAFHEPAAREKQITLELLPLPELPPLFVNRRNFEEVLSNLIINAIKYTPPGGKVVVSAATEDKFLKITVCDNGFGIAAEEQDRVFAPFYRIKNEKTRYTIGTGLGLAIVKSIIEAHGGFIRLQSEADRGSVFDVYFPLADS
ncbi:MAG: response regulator [Syntrophobacteraceae bacterium]|nr:response regulator [Syntrophobacteraceae bacterium]